MDLFLGIDLGASSLKVALIDETGRPVDTERVALSTSRPQAGFSEQDPADWRDALADACQALAGRQADGLARVKALSLSGGAHIAVLCDGTAQPLRPAIMWDDQRAADEARRLAETGEVEKISGNRPQATWTLPQLIWLARHEPQIVEKTEKLFFAKDWLRHQLTNQHSSDATEAVGGMLADLNGQWSPVLQQMSGLEPSAFAALLAPQEDAGRITADAAARFALPLGCPVYQGAIDTSMEWLCLGPPAAGMASLKLASAGVLALSEAKATPVPPVSFYPHVEKGLFYHAAGMSDCMGAIDWVRQNLTPTLSVEQFAAAVEKAPLGAEGLIFYPYLSGARAPFWDADLRAELYGLTRAHATPAIARAAYEGVGHVLTAIWHDMTERLSSKPQSVHLLGGGAHQAFFGQMLADMLDTPLHMGAETDCAVATALLAATAHGVFDTLADAAQAAYQPVQQFVPDKQSHRGYAFIHENFMARHRA